MSTKQVLVVAAHPDDETIGCGGTLARHCAEGDAVRTLFVADGVGARPGADRSENLDQREAAACTALNILGCDDVEFARFADNQLDSVPLLQVVQTIERHIDDVQPHTIFTHHGGDLNIDHRIVHQAVVTACRPQPDHPTAAIYGFEVASSTEWSSADMSIAFRPCRFVNIDAHLAQKMAALRAYDIEMRPFPHARSYEGIEALARWRGVSSGFAAAEAFSVIRERLS